MDYEKMYKEALKRIRRLHDRMQVLSSTDALVASSELEFIFPELAENEDERIRKWLIEYHKQQFENNRDQEVGLFHKDALAYLEKQKEQKPSWSEEDEKMRDRLITRLNWITYNTSTNGTSPNITFFDEIAWLKSLRPQYHGDVTMTEAYKMGLEAGKASSWKPSEHQMTILKAVKDYVGKGSGYWGEGLGSLIEDLEKL